MDNLPAFDTLRIVASAGKGSRTAQEGRSFCFKRAAPRLFEIVSPRPHLSKGWSSPSSPCSPQEGLRVGPGGSGPGFAAFDRLRALRSSDFAGTGRGTGFSGPNKELDQGESREVTASSAGIARAEGKEEAWRGGAAAAATVHQLSHTISSAPIVQRSCCTDLGRARMRSSG